MSNDIKNDLINWNAEQLSDDSPVYNSKDLINALNSIMPSLGSVILTTNNHVLSKQEDWDSITMNTLNMFTTLANSGLPASDFPNNSGILLVLGYTSYNIYIAISGTAVYYRLGGDDWNKLLTSASIKDLTGSVATLMDTIGKLSDQQTTLSSLFNTFKDDTNKQLGTLNTESTSQAKMLEDINNQLLVLGDKIKAGAPVDNASLTAAPSFVNLQTQVNNSAVGTNLLLGTSETLETVTNASGWNTNLPSYLPIVTKVNSDTTYTVSSWLSPASYDMKAQVSWIDASGVLQFSNGNVITAGTSGYSTWTGTITAGSTIRYATIIFDKPQSTDSSVSYCKTKLEIGSHATDWCPNPEDKVTDNHDGTEQLNGVKVQPFNKLTDSLNIRNYILQGDKSITSNPGTSQTSFVDNGNNGQWKLSPEFFNLAKDTPIIIQFDLDVTNSENKSFWTNWSNPWRAFADLKDTPYLANGSHHVIIETTVPKQYSDNTFIPTYVATSATYTISNVSLYVGSKGEVPNSWIPAPEDNLNISANPYPFKAIMSAFSGQNSQSLDLYWTDDYIYFHPINKSIPNGIPKESMRDPSIAYFDNKFWIACTWAIYYSYDLINFTRIDIPSAISTPSYWSWAPEWFIDTDGTPYLFATSGNNASTYDDKANMQIYWCKFNPLDKSVGPWTLVKYNQPTGIKNNIDPSVAYFKGSYYLAMKLEYNIGTPHWAPYIQLYKSDSIDGNYTYIMDLPFQTTNGEKDIPVEGPSLVVNNDTMYCYADGFTNRSSYRLETKDGTTWENMISISALDGSRTQHFTVLPLSSSKETSIIQKAILYYSPTILGSGQSKLRMSIPTQPIYPGVNDIYPQSGIENYYSLTYPKVGDTVEVIIHMDKNGYASKIHFINDNDNPNVTLKIVANDAFKAPNNSSAYITKITHSPVTLTSKGSYGGESPIADPYEVSSAIIDFLGGRNYAYNTEVSNQVVGNKTVGQAIGVFPLDPICLNYFKNKSSVRVSFDIDVNNADGAELYLAFTSKWMSQYCGTLDNSGTFHMSFPITLARDLTSTDTLAFTIDNSTATVKIYNVMLESGTIEHSYVPAIAPRITQDNGAFLLQLTTANNSDLSASIYNFSSGFATFYCQSGVANNPSNNSCRGFFHKDGEYGEGLLVDSDGMSWSIAITGDSSVTYTKLSSDSTVLHLSTGDTASRPTSISTGYQYFDISLNKPIWYTGKNWVDATGATV